MVIGLYVSFCRKVQQRVYHHCQCTDIRRQTTVQLHVCDWFCCIWFCFGCSDL